MNSVHLTIGKEETEIERQTYSLLDWIGDIGGLFDGLSLLASHFIAPIAAYALKYDLLTQLKIPGTNDTVNKSNMSYLRNMVRCCSKKKSKYQKMLDRTTSTIEKQLDILDFVHQ